MSVTTLNVCLELSLKISRLQELNLGPFGHEPILVNARSPPRPLKILFIDNDL